MDCGECPPQTEIEDNNRPPVTEFGAGLSETYCLSHSVCAGWSVVFRVLQGTATMEVMMSTEWYKKKKEKCSWAIAQGRLWFVISLTFSCNNYSLFRLAWITDCFSWDNWYLWHIHDIFYDVISFVFIGQPSRIMCIAQMIIIMLANGH